MRGKIVKIVRVNDTQGYGYIRPDGGGEDRYFHFSSTNFLPRHGKVSVKPVKPLSCTFFLFCSCLPRTAGRLIVSKARDSSVLSRSVTFFRAGRRKCRERGDELCMFLNQALSLCSPRR